MQSQLHEFNMPAQMAAYNNQEGYETADDAIVYEIDLEEGDLVIFGTDGLFDNMWTAEMEAHVASHIKVGRSLDVVHADYAPTSLQCHIGRRSQQRQT